jgi:hypothetical protein
MRARYPLTTIFGLLSIGAYLSLTVVAFAYYPASFSPGANWLSDLGDRLLNPQGAAYYRGAAILAEPLLGAPLS